MKNLFRAMGLLLPAALLALVIAGAPAFSQTVVRTGCAAAASPAGNGNTGKPYAIDENLVTCINGSIALSGFTPAGTYASLTATGSSASVALPAGAVVVFQNTGTTAVSCTLGVGSATATAGMIQVPPSSSVPVVVGTNTFGACIDETGSASNVVRLMGGAGLANGFGGGGGGSSSSTGVADLTQTFSITSTTTSTALALTGTNSVQFNLTGTFVATVLGQISNDNTNWLSVPLLNMTPVPPVYATATAGATAVGNYLLVGTQGARYARVSVTYTSGTVAGAMTAVSQGPSVTFGDYINYQQLIAAVPSQSPAVPIGGVSICDGANGTTNPCTNPATVKPASTPAAATDKAVVTDQRPGTIVQVSQNPSTPTTATLQNAAVASGNGTVLNTNGMSSATLTVNCATCSGGTTINFEATEDGTNYSAVNAVQLGTTTIASTTAASGISLWEMPVAGSVSLRARISGYSAGTVTITGHTVPVAYNPKVAAANQAGTWTVQPGNTPNTTPWLTKQTDGTTIVLTDPCQGATKSFLPITLATAAVKVIATGVSAKKIYICAIDFTNNAADSIAVFEATTGTTCVTSPVAVFGAGTSVATAATGYNFAANGGISKGNGGFSIAQTTVNNNDLCIAQSAATQLTGGITYVTQ